MDEVLLLHLQLRLLLLVVECLDVINNLAASIDECQNLDLGDSSNVGQRLDHSSRQREQLECKSHRYSDEDGPVLNRAHVADEERN